MMERSVSRETIRLLCTNSVTQKSENGVIDQEVTWNFQKFLIDEEGRLVDVVMPKESPMSEKIVQWITKE